MNLTIELTEDEERIINSYAKFHGVTIPIAFKNALLDIIEDEYDSLELKMLANSRFGEETMTHDELIKELFGEEYDV